MLPGLKRGYMPDDQDVTEAVKAAREDLNLILKFEFKFQKGSCVCVCRAFEPGRVRRADVIRQAKCTSPSGAARQPAYLAYNCALDVYRQADRARAEPGSFEAVGVAPLERLPL